VEASSAERSEVSALTRVGRLAGSVLNLHLQVAKQEAERDRARLIGGGAFLAVGGVMLLVVVVLLQVAAVDFVHDALQSAGVGHSGGFAVLSVAGGNLFLGLLFLLLGSRKMKSPMLPETRSLLRKTLGALTEP